jgi:hypothetical protein
VDEYASRGCLDAQVDVKFMKMKTQCNSDVRDRKRCTALSKFFVIEHAVSHNTFGTPRQITFPPASFPLPSGWSRGEIRSPLLYTRALTSLYLHAIQWYSSNFRVSTSLRSARVLREGLLRGSSPLLPDPASGFGRL